MGTFSPGPYVPPPIAVTTVINWLRSGRRRREFVYYCGVIGLCTPCTRAPPLQGGDPSRRGGLLALAPAAARERKPPRQEGLGPT